MNDRRPLVVLFVILFLVMVGFGIMIPILPFYVRHFGGNTLALGLLMASYSIMQFLFAPYWGRLSDRIGRRPVLLIGLSGYGISFILYGLSTQLWMLFVTRTMAGVISSATLPTAMAYVADITTPENRAKGMGMMGAAVGLGFVCGPALGALVGGYGLSVPFFVAGGIAMLTLPFAFHFLRESLDLQNHRPSTSPPTLSFALIHHPQFPLFLIALAASTTMGIYETTLALFSADRVGLTLKGMGLLLAGMGLLGVMIQGGAVGKLERRFGDIHLLSVGLILSGLGLVSLLLARNIPMIWIFSSIFGIGSSLVRPLLSTILTRTSTEGKGAVVGIQQSFDSLGRIFGPILGGATYELNQSFPYLLAASILFSVVLATRRSLRCYRKVAGVKDA